MPGHGRWHRHPHSNRAAPPVVRLVEIAEVTPPLGFNLFVLQTMTGRDSNYVAYASIPFFVTMVICIALITVFPQIVTVLPDMLISTKK